MAAPKLKYASGNSASTTLSSGISNSATAAPLTSDTNFNAKSGEGMVIMGEGTSSEELAYATGKAGSSLTIPLANRGLEGTSAAGQASGNSVKGVISAGMWNDLIDGVATVVNSTDGTIKKATGAEVTTGTEDAKIVTPKAIKDAGITATPVKASGAEVTTGTDDAKFVTPKAMADAGVNVASALSSKLFYISKDMTVASGDISYTGIGFKPTAMIAISAKSGTTNSHMGMVDSSKTGSSIYNLAGNFSKFDAFIVLTTGAGAYQEALVKTFDNDGFTLTWTKTGSPTGTGDILILCFK